VLSTRAAAPAAVLVAATTPAAVPVALVLLLSLLDRGSHVQQNAADSAGLGKQFFARLLYLGSFWLLCIDLLGPAIQKGCGTRLAVQWAGQFKSGL